MDFMYLLTSLAVMNGVVIGLALLLQFAKKHLSSYGPAKLHINGEKEIDVQGGSSLLSSLFANKYFIPSACGGKGSCGYCKLTVKEGGGSALATEQMVLTRREIKSGVRLSCQVRVRNDMIIHIPEEYLAIKEYETEVMKVEVMTDLIKKITFKLLNPNKITFKPGQYVQVMQMINGEAVYRGYSIASAPSHDFMVELNIRRVEGGLVSPMLHALKEGDKVNLSGAYGDFYLREDNDRSVVCIAGGVGLAPMKSIIQHMIEKQSKRKVYLYYGARTLPLLYDHQQFVDLAKLDSNFIYVPALSDNPPENEWSGARGFITSVFESHFPEREPAEAYLCGPPIMIDSLMPLLAKKGITDIYYDKF